MADDKPHKPPEDNEEVYYEGSPSLKGEVGSLIVYGAIALVILIAGFWGGIATGGLGFLMLPLALLLAAGVVAYPVVMNKTKRFKITNYRIDYERGVLRKRIDTLELWHVEDIKFDQRIWERFLKVGTLTVVSHDDTNPNLEMRGLPDPRKLFDVLKQRVISVKRQRGVLKIDN